MSTRLTLLPCIAGLAKKDKASLSECQGSLYWSMQLIFTIVGESCTSDDKEQHLLPFIPENDFFDGFLPFS